MTTPVVTAREEMSFRDLAALLYAKDIGAVPVIALAGQGWAWYQTLTSLRRRQA